MTLRALSLRNGIAALTSAIPVFKVDEWRHWMINACHVKGRRVVALFVRCERDTLRVYGIIANDARGELKAAAFDVENNSYPSLTPELPQVHLFERELAEEFGIIPEGHPWLKPVRKTDAVPFYHMEGDGIHEVAVGPVHAGVIEPGHFRFQCNGEKVFHLEIALGYQHRGVEPMMVKTKPALRAILAESIAGDTCIGHALAYAHAVEGFTGHFAPQRGKALRAVALELERLANHAGDLGALSADIGFIPANACFGRIRGEFLNLLMEMTGNRYGRSFVRPGGVLFDINERMAFDIAERVHRTEAEMSDMADFFFNSSSVLARLEHVGVIDSETAVNIGLVGPSARASGLARDVRCDHPTGVYRFRQIPPVRMTSGDVYARARVRSLESESSCEFIKEQLRVLPPEKVFDQCAETRPDSIVVSMVEGWRGEIVHIVMTDGAGEIAGYKIIDPSFHNWTALALAMRNTQISDFPLCNKSFNLSYAGHDL